MGRRCREAADEGLAGRTVIATKSLTCPSGILSRSGEGKSFPCDRNLLELNALVSSAVRGPDLIPGARS